MTQADVKTQIFHSSDELEVAGKRSSVAIEVMGGGHWHETTISRDEARSLATNLLAWLNYGDGGTEV